MKIIPDKWFRLPQLGKDVFSDLMKAKVKYDTKFGFQFTSQTNIPRAITILAAALQDEVEVTKTCFICGNSVEDNQENLTICQECLGKEGAYDLYMMRFAKLMESI